ncbi:MAG: TRAP transporter large permease subunit, partial [Alphaproteobacteria bacterium]|nr:TRAP transporter large permease subunit [Alphaproteobacteria bacterium]
IKLGVWEPAAHLFAFYFAILSAITPPVALAVYAAAGLAKSDLWETGWAAVKVGAAGFIVPFMFVFEPALMLSGEWTSIALASATAGLGVIFLAASLHRYFLVETRSWEQVALFGGAILLVTANPWADIAGIALGGIVVLAQTRRRPATAPSGMH